MKKKILLSLIGMLALMTTSCTQPDGYIGKWFGSWYLEEILIDGEIDEEYTEYKANDTRQVMVNFQGQIFNMAYLNGLEIYGMWSYAGETLTLIASYNSGSGYESPLFDPYPVVLHFPAGIEQMEITVTKLQSKEMQWQITDTQGQLITYNFKKYP